MAKAKQEPVVVEEEAAAKVIEIPQAPAPMSRWVTIDVSGGAGLHFQTDIRPVVNGGVLWRETAVTLDAKGAVTGISVSTAHMPRVTLDTEMLELMD